MFAGGGLPNPQNRARNHICGIIFGSPTCFLRTDFRPEAVGALLETLGQRTGLAHLQRSDDHDRFVLRTASCLLPQRLPVVSCVLATFPCSTSSLAHASLICKGQYSLRVCMLPIGESQLLSGIPYLRSSRWPPARRQGAGVVQEVLGFMLLAPF